MPRDGNDADTHDFGGVELERFGRYRQRLKSSRGNRDAAIERDRLLCRGRKLDGKKRDGEAEKEPGAVTESWKPHHRITS